LAQLLLPRRTPPVAPHIRAALSGNGARHCGDVRRPPRHDEGIIVCGTESAVVQTLRHSVWEAAVRPGATKFGLDKGDGGKKRTVGRQRGKSVGGKKRTVGRRVGSGGGAHDVRQSSPGRHPGGYRLRF